MEKKKEKKGEQESKKSPYSKLKDDANGPENQNNWCIFSVTTGWSHMPWELRRISLLQGWLCF